MRIIIPILSLFLLVTLPLKAEERADHYEGASIATKEEAVKLLSAKRAEINTLITEDKITDSAFEKIHETSYTLENIVDKLKESETGVAVDALDEVVQAIHYASEEHEEEKVREWAGKLDAAAAGVETSSLVAEVVPEEKEFYDIVIKDHKFTPETLMVPAGVKIKLIVDNQDPTPEEFESHDMNREKIIAGNTKATIFVGPLEPGKYHYFGEFNMDSANGYIVAVKK